MIDIIDEINGEKVVNSEAIHYYDAPLSWVARGAHSGKPYYVLHAHEEGLNLFYLVVHLETEEVLENLKSDEYNVLPYLKSKPLSLISFAGSDAENFVYFETKILFEDIPQNWLPSK